MTNNELAAWVAAGAAVIQAIGAIAAIIYSGKLARDSAKREKAAAAAAAQREAAAIAAQVEREEAAALAQEDRLAREAEEQERLRRIEHDERYNAPLLAAKQFGRVALAEIERELRVTQIAAENGDRSHAYARVTKTQKLLLERLESLVEQATTPPTAAALRRLEVAFDTGSSSLAPARERAERLSSELAEQRDALEAVELLIRDEPGRF